MIRRPPMGITPQTANLVNTAVTDTDAVEAAAVRYPIDKQHRRTALGRHHTVDYSVAIN